MNLFMDGFSHYATADIANKWTTRSDALVTWSIEAGGRTANCLRRNSTSNGSGSGRLNIAPRVRQTGPWSTQSSGVLGFAIKVTDLQRIQPNLNGGGVQTSGGCLMILQYSVWSMMAANINQDGTLSIYRGSSSAPLATSINALQNGVWCYLEFKWVIHPTAGNFIIRANGIEVLNYTGTVYPISHVGFADPPNLWASIDLFGIQSQVSLLEFRVCDLYLNDLTGSFNNDFEGDISIGLIVPDAAGFQTQWTPNAGNNWSNVNEVPPSGDTNFNAAITPGLVDTYSYQPVSNNPRALQHCIMTRKVVPGAATIQSTYRQGGTNYLQPAQAVQQDTAYAFNLFPYDTNPASGVRFTSTEINANEFGVTKET